ncbi:MAG: radical SAM protein [Candidatus Omnitrophota bacterium]
MGSEIPEHLEAKIWEKNIPFSSGIELTWRCNHKCIHCYQYPPSSHELSTQEIKDILTQLAAAGCLFLQFTGGEPLLRPDFWNIADFTRKLSFAVILYTNGSLVTREVASRIKELRFVQVHISLLGAFGQTHDKIVRVEGSYKKVIKAIEYLRSKDVNVMLNTVLMKENFSEFKEIIRLAESWGAEYRISPVITPANEGSKAPLDLRISEAQLKEFYSFLFNIKKVDFGPYAEGDKEPLCGYGRKGGVISASGDLYPCIGAPIVLGNLREKSFREIWETSVVLKKIRAAHLENLKVCNTCSLSFSCIRCSGLALFEDGDLFGPSHECCRITKIINEVIANSQLPSKVKKVFKRETVDSLESKIRAL